MLFGRLGVADRDLSEMDDLSLAVGAIPDAASARHLVLPLLELDATDRHETEVALKRMLPFRADERVGGQLIPGVTGGSRGLPTQILPTIDGALRVPQLPLALSSGPGDSLTTLWHAYGRLTFVPVSSNGPRSLAASSGSA